MISRVNLGQLTFLSRGSRSIIFRADEFYLPGSSASLVYKEFTDEVAAQVRSAQAAIAFRADLSPSERAIFDEYTSWPIALVDRGEPGSTCGLLMHLIPLEFFCQMADPDSGQVVSRPRQMTWLISSAKVRKAAKIDLADVDKTERLILLTQLTNAISFLHEHGWVFGDLHFGKVVFGLNPPRIRLLGCHSTAAISDPTRRLASTPFWDPPECQIGSQAGSGWSQELQDDYTDVYKLGLAILRSLTPGQGAATTRTPDRVAEELDNQGVALVESALSMDRLSRPTASELHSYLSRIVSQRIGIPEGFVTGQIMSSAASAPGGHVFISYVSDDSALVDRLQKDLEGAGIAVWRDRTSLGPGDRWRDSIRRAIAAGTFFICCFSEASGRRSRSYMNEELALAIEELRFRNPDKVWFLPVIFPGGEVPDKKISASESLRDFNYTLLSSGNWVKGVNDLIRTIQQH